MKKIRTLFVLLLFVLSVFGLFNVHANQVNKTDQIINDYTRKFLNSPNVVTSPTVYTTDTTTLN